MVSVPPGAMPISITSLGLIFASQPANSTDLLHRRGDTRGNKAIEYARMLYPLAMLGRNQKIRVLARLNVE